MYSCFGQQGETILPDQAAINAMIQKGLEPKIFLDSCVCLHIIKLVDYGKKATSIDFNKLIALKEYLHHHPSISITPFFGLIELCSHTGALNSLKFADFQNRINFFTKLPLKYLKNFRYDFHRDYWVIKPIENLPNIYPFLTPQLKNTYCCLLKIRSLALNGLSKATARKNISSYLDWMVDELDMIRGTEYRLALYIFGGVTSTRKMIGLDNKPAEAKKRMLGTCWDIFHCKNIGNSFRLFEMLGRNFEPYFLTSDAVLFEVIRGVSLTIIKDGGEQFMSSFINNGTFNFPHFTEDFLDQNNTEMLDLFFERCNKVYEFDEKKVDLLIRGLEKENGISKNDIAMPEE